MARSIPTQQKRQRENKLREKAQLKREQRQQRQADKKLMQAQGDGSPVDQAVSVEGGDGIEPIVELNGIDAPLMNPVGAYQEPANNTLNQTNLNHQSQPGGIMASKLFVGNLPRTATDNDLAGFVTDAGFQVASAQVIKDKMTGDSKGFGFVELADGADLQQVIGQLNGQRLHDRQLTVNEARPQVRTGFGGPRGGGGGFGGGGGRDRGGFGRKRNY